MNAHFHNFSRFGKSTEGHVSDFTYMMILQPFTYSQSLLTKIALSQLISIPASLIFPSFSEGTKLVIIKDFFTVITKSQINQLPSHQRPRSLALLQTTKVVEWTPKDRAGGCGSLKTQYSKTTQTLGLPIRVQVISESECRHVTRKHLHAC